MGGFKIFMRQMQSMLISEVQLSIRLPEYCLRLSMGTYPLLRCGD